MRQHIASAHGNEKPFKCTICNQRCALKHNLTQHIKRVHENKMKNQCKALAKKPNTGTETT